MLRTLRTFSSWSALVCLLATACGGDDASNPVKDAGHATDAKADHSVSDGSTDAGPDAPPDASSDGGLDATDDVESDASEDASDAAAEDAGSDAASDDASTDGAPDDAPDDVAASDGANDASSSDADAGPQAVCDPTKDFGSPVAVPGLGSDVFVALSPDELTAYVPRNFSGGGNYPDLVVGTRTSMSDSFLFTAPSLIKSPYAVFSVWISADGLRAYGDAVGLPGGPFTDSIYHATRADAQTTTVFSSIDFPITKPVLVNYMFSASLPDDELEMFIDAFSIYVTSRATINDAFPTPQQLGGIVGDSPVVSADGLRLFVREGSGTITMHERATRTTPFGPGISLSTINAAGGGKPLWISKDGCRLYLLAGSSPGIRMATRPL